VGTTDVMAILVYNQPVDYNEINKRLTAAKAGDLDQAMASVLGNELIPADALTYSQGATFGAAGPASKNAVAFVLKVDKR
jgi:hypothetical protein